MNVHIFQHVPFEGPGIIADWCLSKGHRMTTTGWYAPEHHLPTPDQVDLLVIMGGPMGVYDENIHPWLREEKAYITSFLQKDKPILGICLGAQLLAVCSGAIVKAAPQKEIGWFPVKPTAAAKDQPWFYSIFESEPVLFHWHGDRFEIPTGAVNLAYTAANDNQAFLLHEKALGLQFHTEIKKDGLFRMMDEGRDELQEGAYIQSADTILSTSCFEGSHHIMRKVLEHLTAGTK